jgi:hypothetical protein
MDRLRRERAGSLAMRAAYPAVLQLRIELKFASSDPNTPTPQAHVLYPPARAFFSYPCPHANCDGHFDLTAAVRGAIEGEAPIAQGMLECGGSRARDHGSKQLCLLQLHYGVSATYEPRGKLRD